MVKIPPIGPITSNIAISKAEIVQKTASVPYKIGATAIGAAGVILSSFIKDFNQTVDENYFQLKINPETGQPYTPDVFQKAAAMNLYLGNDVLVTAPTGTGKTAIAEYAITKNLHEGKRTFYTAPLKALSNEKYLSFCRTYGKENVGLLTGDKKINPDAPIIMMTTEVYRNMCVSNYFNMGFSEDSKKGLPDNVKTVIFDELQYLGDTDRGGIWEQSIMFTPRDVQMLSLSATIKNNKEINRWMAYTKGISSVCVTPKEGYMPDRKDTKEAVLIDVPPENRRVPLTYIIEHGAAEIKIPRGGSKKDKIKAKKEGARKSQSIYAQPREEVFKALTKKLNEEGKLPAIYFVFSKKDSRHLLKYLSTESELLTTDEEQKEIVNILQRYIDEGIYLGESLNTEALIKGYAVHNAGLLPTQKMLIEELLQKKLIKLVIATETLSAGINMPVKTTVISSPRKPASVSDGGEDRKVSLNANQLHQMGGRAGRPGMDTEGFCILISCNPVQNKFYENLIGTPSSPLESNLDIDYSFITSFMSNFRDDEELRRILSKSFYVFNPEGGIYEDKLDELMNRYLLRRDLLIKGKYIDENGKLTTKGQMIKELNGYEQIPLINIIHNKTLAKLNPVQLAGVIGGLANIEYNTRGEFPQKPFNVNAFSDQAMAEAAASAFFEVKDYDRKVTELYPERELSFEPKIVEHLYAWALLNIKDEDSKNNWKEIYNSGLKYSIHDDGTLFKEINMTIDLLKQLCDAAKEGEYYSESREDKEYYSSLRQKLVLTIDLIQREPVNAGLK